MHPGEKLENGIQDIYILGEDEGLILKANETFKDTYEDDEEVYNVTVLYDFLPVRTFSEKHHSYISTVIHRKPVSVAPGIDG